MSHFRKPLRYNITLQWSDRHGAYICFVGALLKSGRLFAPDMNLIGTGACPEQALTAGLNLSYRFLDLLSELAILPPREEITETSEPAERELTVQELVVNHGSH